MIAPTRYENKHVFAGSEVLILTDTTVYEFAFVPEGTAFFNRGFDGSDRTRSVTFPPELGIRGAIR